MSSNEQRARALAEKFRAEHRLGTGPIKDMFELVHSTVGIDVLSMPADEAEHGLSMIDPDTDTVVIAVATTGNPMRQRSTIAHELGHHLAGDLTSGKTLTPGERSPEEIRADAFARHLLLPLGAVRQRTKAAGSVASLTLLSDLVQEFEVSPSLAAIQLSNARLIDEATCVQWQKLASANLAVSYGWLNQYRSLAADSQQPRAPQKLMKRAAEGYRRGVLGVAELASWYRQDADTIAEELGPADAAGVDDDEFWGEGADLFPVDAR